MSVIKNPYIGNDDSSNLRNSIIVLVDVLGYKDMILEAKKNGLEKETLKEYRKNIYAPYRNLSFSKDRIFGENRCEVKYFSDNVIIGYPIGGDGEIEFGSVVDNMSMFQFSMALSGLFVRGALAAGDIFIDEHIV